MADEDYLWTADQLKIIDEHKEYHEKMIAYIEELRRDGPSSFAPTSSLPICFNRKPKLTGFLRAACQFVSIENQN